MTVAAQHDQVGVAPLGFTQQRLSDVLILHRHMTERGMDAVMREVKDGVLTEHRFVLDVVIFDHGYDGDVLGPVQIGHGFGERTRGPTRVDVASDAPYLVLFLVLGDDLPAYDRYQLRILDWRGDLLFAGEPLEGGLYAEHSLGVPRRLLAEGVLRLELVGLAEGGPVRLEERVVALNATGEGGR